MHAMIPVANGSEEMEAVIIADLLRRAHIDAELVAIGASLQITGSRGIRFLADRYWNDAETSTDALILPGGMEGMEALRAHQGVLALVNRRVAADALVGAICAAPLVLQAAGVLEGRRFTAHPGVREMFSTGTYVEQRVVEDGCIVTSQGPGTAMEFALCLIAHLKNRKASQGVAAGLILP